MSPGSSSRPWPSTSSVSGLGRDRPLTRELIRPPVTTTVPRSMTAVGRDDPHVRDDGVIHDRISTSVVGQAGEQGLVVEHADHRGPLLLELEDEGNRLAGGGGVQGRGRLVQQEETRLGDDGVDDVDPLLFAAGEGGGKHVPERTGDGQALQGAPAPAPRSLHGKAPAPPRC